MSSGSVIISYLKSIDCILREQLATMTIKRDPGFRGNLEGWTYLKVGKSWFYEKTVTYTGSAENHDIIFPVSVQLNRIEQIWNDATSKDYSIQVFGAGSYYTVIRSAAGNTNTSRWIQLGLEYKFPAGTRLRIAYSNTTGAKICVIRVQVEEL